MRTLNILYILIFLLSSCTSDNKAERKDNATPQPLSVDKPQLPFIGVRYFETRPMEAGKWMPHRKVEIKENGTVEFAFEMANMDDSVWQKGVYNAGTFKKVVKCVFKELENETRFYEITADRIYETDSNGVKLMHEDCCNLSDTLSNCTCISEYFEGLSW